MVFVPIFAAFSSLVSGLLLAQQPAGATDEGGGIGLLNNPLLPMVVIGILFYFMLILPERKKKKELENTLNGLKKNDPVITLGGICGTIVNASPGSKTVIVRVDENTRIKVLRSHISHVGPYDEAEEKKEGA